jgi:hypothetical protein
MAVYGLSLNATLDGTAQTALIRFTLPDNLIADFLTHYRAQFSQGENPPPLTDVAVFKQWARQTIAFMQAEVRRGAERKAADDAVTGLPPPAIPIES